MAQVTDLLQPIFVACTGCGSVRLAVVHAELILVHPFRDGNGRLARLVSLLMARQAGVHSLDFSALPRVGGSERMCRLSTWR